jgi:hypothetical protein
MALRNALTRIAFDHDEQGHNVPSPLEGEGQGGGYAACIELLHTPLPNPPPQGGREQTEFAARTPLTQRVGG